MMWSTIRRKAASTGSSMLANYVNGTVQSLERARPALAGSTSRGYITTSEALNLGRGSKLLPQVHHDAPVYSQSLRDVLPSFKTDFPMQKWVRSFSSNGGHVDRVGISEPIAEIEAKKGICNAKKMKFAEIENKASNGPIPFTLSGGLYGGLLSAPIVNSPQAASMSVGAVASPTFLPNLALFWHINNGIEEILADYVHHEMTRSLMLVLMRLFLIVAAKDVFVATN